MSLNTPSAAVTVLAAALLIGWAGTAPAQTPPRAPAPAVAAAAAKPAPADRPEVLKGIEKHGFEVIGEFQAPGGLRGFAGVVGGQQPAAAFVTPDGQHVLVGSLFNAEGEDIGAEPVDKLAAAPMSAQAWQKLEASSWVRDGRADAPRIVYTFSDANCPYCHRFWEAARPWVDAGKVQLRHVMVGVIREDSPGKAAAILGAPNPSAALLENERLFDRGGIAAKKTFSAALANKLDANQVLMIELGFQGTPGILFMDDKGLVERRSGMPQGEDMTVVLGPR